MNYTLSPLGDHAVVIELSQEISLATQNNVQAITMFLDENPPFWMVEYIPAYTTVTIVYNFEKTYAANITPYQLICNHLNSLLLQIKVATITQQNIVKIPVVYGNQYGPDLEFVAAHNQLTIDKVIAIHTGGQYSVHMIGFSPGFPFIGGMSKQICTPRRSTPRLKIPARTVGIAGMQTGIYPIETPGGWQMIGRTPLELFLPDKEIPSLLKSGDQIEFYQITEAEYLSMRGDDR